MSLLNMLRKYYLKVYGCQANVYDAGKLAEVLESSGYSPTSDIGQAGIVLVITCVVRQNAEDRATGYIASLAGLKEQSPNIIIGVCGCLVTEPGRDVRKQFPHVDWFIPPNGAKTLAKFLGPQSPVNSHQSLVVSHQSTEDRRLMTEDRRLVTIMSGCDNYCSYCVVPYVRGREFSRPLDDILAEVRNLLEQGVTDITLLGQNVNSYKYGLAKLLRGIHQFVIRNSAFVIRFMTSHPRDMSDEIIEAVAELPYVAKEFHLPLQSGDNEILKAMNRGYTVEYFLGRVAKIRSLLPRARITTDLMVGFPGESEAQFNNSLTLIKEVKFNAINMFAYSARPLTAAAKMPGQLPAAVKQARLRALIETNRRLIRTSRPPG